MALETFDDIVEDLANRADVYSEARSEFVSEFKERIKAAIQLEATLNPALGSNDQDARRFQYLWWGCTAGEWDRLNDLRLRAPHQFDVAVDESMRSQKNDH
jgi:hypothetical protein